MIVRWLMDQAQGCCSSGLVVQISLIASEGRAQDIRASIR